MTTDKIWETYLEIFLHLQQLGKKKKLHIWHPETMYSATRDDCQSWQPRNPQKDNFFWVKLFTPCAFISYYQKKNWNKKKKKTGSSALTLDCFNEKNKDTKLKAALPPYLLLPLPLLGFAPGDSGRGGILGRNSRDLVQRHAHPSLPSELPLHGRQSSAVEAFWAMDFTLRERREDKT